MKKKCKQVLDELSEDSVDKTDKDVVLQKCEEFNSLYRDIVVGELSDAKVGLGRILGAVDLIVQSSRFDMTPQNSNALVNSKKSYDEKAISLMAHILAYWTLDSAEKQDNSNKEITSELRQPHAVQIVSIILMLGIGDGQEYINNDVYPTKVSLRNHLSQIKTGEGKSVTIAVISTIMCLLGCSVNVACYSKYLSSRDLDDFDSMFNAFKVRKYIDYGTFPKLCEDFINEKGDVRKLVSDVLLKEDKVVGAGTDDNIRIEGDCDASPCILSSRPKVLLIDEVDVFFSKTFYGNQYHPYSEVRHPSITVLLKHIWSVRKNISKLEDIKKSAEFTHCLEAMSEGVGQELLQEALKMLYVDLIKFEREGHHYVLVDGQICYEDGDSLSNLMFYGYETMWAYFKEYESDRSIDIDRRLVLYVRSGDFSYAEVPKLYAAILGCTGTLETISKQQKNVLKNDYNISKNSYLPSVYGENQLHFAEDSNLSVIIESGKEDWFRSIRNEINTRLKAINGSEYKRAVLVFFQTTNTLLEFYNANVMEDLKETVSYMIEATKDEDKESKVREAVVSGSVTLLQRLFGRGTDFYCLDEQLINAGGVHVIQTFVSEEVAEEVQIKGRTARQGNKGSFSFVLQGEHLEKFHIGPEDISTMKKTNKFYSTINEKREEFYAANYPMYVSHVKEICSQHRESCVFLQQLHNYSSDLYQVLGVKNGVTFSDLKKAKKKALLKFHPDKIYGSKSVSDEVKEEANKKLQMINEAYDILSDERKRQKYDDSFLEGTTLKVKDFLLKANKGPELKAKVHRCLLLMDATLSMSHLITKTKHCIVDFFNRIQQILKDQGCNAQLNVQFAAYRNYNTPVEQILQLSPLSTDPSKLQTFMRGVDVAGGWGNEAIEVGLLHANTMENLNHVILIGDRPPNTRLDVEVKRNYDYGEQYWSKSIGPATYYKDELRELVNKKVIVDTFHVAVDAAEKFGDIARFSGGSNEFLDINSAGGSQQLIDAFCCSVLKQIGGEAFVEAYTKVFCHIK